MANEFNIKNGFITSGNSNVYANLNVTGGITATTISATTYSNLPSITGLYLPLSGGTVTGGTIFQSGLTANTISATTYYNVSSNFQYEIHVSQVDGNDTTGDGSLLKPVATITKGLTLVGSQRKTIIVHPGTYTESPSITVQYTTITGPGLIGGNIVIAGTVSTNNGCTISGIKMTNLTITTPTGAGNVNILNCEISGTLTKNSNADYTVLRLCDYGVANITGGGLVAIFGGNPNFTTVNNASANVIIKSAVTVAPALTAGTLSLVDSVVVAAVTNAVTSAASSVITIANCQLLTSALNNVAPVSLSGFYSIFNCVFDKSTSTLVVSSGTGGSTNSIDYFQFVNADKFITQGGTSLQYVMGDGSLSNGFTGGTVSGATNFTGGLTATTISATTYQNLPQSVSGTGTQDYLTKWDPSGVGIVDSTIYDNVGFVGINITSPSYGEAVSIQTANKGVLIDDAYVIQTGNGSLAFASSYDYSSWGGGGEIAIGTRAPLSNSTGYGNIGIGDKALLQNITGSFNIGIGGTQTLGNNVGGNSNIGIGTDALLINIEGSNNVSIGESSLRNNTSGSTNIAIGTSAGYSNLNDNGNVYIGDSAGYSNVGGNNIFIGYGAGSGDTSSSDRLNIGDTIFGSLSGKTIGINNLNPITTLDVSGTTRIIGGLTATTISATTYINLPVSGLTQGTGISVTNNGVGGYTIANTDRGSSENIFKNIQIAGVTQFSANSNTANLNFSGINVTITSGASNTLIFSAGTGGGGGGVTGSGTSNFIPRWTGTTALGNSLIQDNGTNIGVNTTPSSSYKMSIYSITNTPLYVQNQASNGTSISVYSNGSGSQTGISSIGYGDTSSNNTGVIGQAYDGLLAIGIKGNVGITEFGSITTGIGGYFDGIGDGGFGVPTNSYSVQLIDGTEGVDKVLISKTSDGKANWSNTLTGLTTVRATTISGATYQGNVVTQITAGSGISVNQSTGNVIITATGGAGSTNYGAIYTTSNNFNFI